MIFKRSILSLYSLVILVSIGAHVAQPVPSIQEILDLLQKFSKYNQNIGEKDVYSSESVQETSRMKPVAAPPPAPSMGDWQPPVAWPYPPAPNTGGANEFPLLERFMKANNIQSNNQLSNGPSQSNWSPSPPPPAQPAPVVVSAPAPVQWSPPKQQNNLNTYLEYGLLQPQGKPMGNSMSAGLSLPPPLNPNEHFQVQHSQNGGQQRHFRLDSVRMADTSEMRDKLNVSFIMPPEVKPLTLNFDTSEVFVDTGDKQQSGQPSVYTDLDAIIKSARNANSGTSGTVTTQSGTGSRPEENDDDYIVVRHDMNKYAYDLPKGSAVDPSSTSGNTQPVQVENYDVSGQKSLRFTLGRVSG